MSIHAMNIRSVHESFVLGQGLVVGTKKLRRKAEQNAVVACVELLRLRQWKQEPAVCNVQVCVLRFKTDHLEKFFNAYQMHSHSMLDVVLEIIHRRVYRGVCRKVMNLEGGRNGISFDSYVM